MVGHLNNLNVGTRPRHRGFTLIEAALATVIVGVGIVAVMQLFGTCTQENMTSERMTTAMMLAGTVRESMQGLAFRDPMTAGATIGPEAGETLATYDDIDDFDGRSFNPPIDATGASQPKLSQYTQVVSVVPVYPSKLSSNSNESALEIPKSVYTGAVRVMVRVLYQANPGQTAQELFRSSWIRLDQ